MFKEFLSILKIAVRRIGNMLFPDRESVLSEEGKELLMNPDNYKKIQKAREEFKKGVPEVTIDTTVGEITLLNPY